MKKIIGLSVVLFGLQMAFAQQEPTNLPSASAQKIQEINRQKEELKKEQEKLKAEKELLKEKKKAEKQAREAEKKKKRQQKIQQKIDKIEQKIQKAQNKYDKENSKYEKAVAKGISTEKELKWRGKLLDMSSEILKMRHDLEKEKIRMKDLD